MQSMERNLDSSMWAQTAFVKHPRGNVWGGMGGQDTMNTEHPPSFCTYSKINEAEEKMKRFLVNFQKGVMNNALWIPGWKVTEHKNQDSSVKLILSGKEAENIHPLCAACTEKLVFEENMGTCSPCQRIIKEKMPSLSSAVLLKNPGAATAQKICQEPPGSALLEPLHSSASPSFPQQLNGDLWLQYPVKLFHEWFKLGFKHKHSEHSQSPCV